MKVSFSTVNPQAFVRLKEIDRNYVSPKEKKKQAHLAKLGCLFKHNCGNTSCNKTIDFIYESGKSESDTKKENDWVYFRQINNWLCPGCADIQTNRQNKRIAYFERIKENRRQKREQNDSLG